MTRTPLRASSNYKAFWTSSCCHWSGIAEALQSGDVFLPLLLEDDDGIAHANDWAHGFMRGMALRQEDWVELLEDEDHGGSLVPILALAHEHDPDPSMRPYQEPMDADRREQLIVGIAAGVTALYRYFEPRQRMQADRRGSGKLPTAVLSRRLGAMIRAPAGPGKKYKQCCGRPTLH